MSSFIISEVCPSIDMLEKLTVSCRDNGKYFTDFQRITIINELLSKTSYRLINTNFDNDLFALFGKKPLCKDKMYCVVSSHIDVSPFVTQLFSCVSRNILWGTYDNSITNCAILWNMISSTLSDSVLIAFTGDEEGNMNGARNLLTFLEYYKIACYVVLDVTNEAALNSCFTVENVYWKPLIRNRFNEFIQIIPKTIPYAVIPSKDDDESHIYGENNNSFSICLPVIGKMHLNHGVKIPINAYVIYESILPIIINALPKFIKSNY